MAILSFDFTFRVFNFSFQLVFLAAKAAPISRNVVVVTVFIGRFEIHTMVYDKVYVYK